MMVLAEKRQFVLPAQCSNPDVVGGDWSSRFSKFILQAGVKLRRRLRNFDDSAFRQQTGQPRFVLFPDAYGRTQFLPPSATRPANHFRSGGVW